VLTSNHLHTICRCKEGHDVGLVWRNIKSFTAMELIDAIINNKKESRKEYLLHVFEAAGKKSSSNVRYKCWEHENQPVLSDSTEMYNQRLNYLHWNPVTASLVVAPWHWINSSAADYFTEKKWC
jgi:hypothetical protein